MSKTSSTFKKNGAPKEESSTSVQSRLHRKDQCPLIEELRPCAHCRVEQSEHGSSVTTRFPINLHLPVRFRKGPSSFASLSVYISPRVFGTAGPVGWIRLANVDFDELQARLDNVTSDAS